MFLQPGDFFFFFLLHSLMSPQSIVIIAETSCFLLWLLLSFCGWIQILWILIKTSSVFPFCERSTMFSCIFIMQCIVADWSNQKASCALLSRTAWLLESHSNAAAQMSLSLLPCSCLLHSDEDLWFWLGYVPLAHFLSYFSPRKYHSISES